MTAEQTGLCKCGSSKTEARCDCPTRRKARVFQAFEAQRHAEAQATCLHAGCGRRAIDSHSVSESAWLATIAEDCHVLGHDFRLLRGSPMEEGLPLRLLGLAQASVFRGFCSSHDLELFSVIDAPDTDPTSEFCARAYYRAMAYEYVAKRCWINWLRAFARQALQESRGRDFDYGVSMLRTVAPGARETIQRFDEAGAIVVARAWREVRGLALETESLPIAAAGCFTPPFDALGQVLQDLSDPAVVPENVGVTLCGGSRYALLLVRRRDTRAARLLGQVAATNPNDLRRAIANILFRGAIQNVFIRPSHWNSLPPDLQRGVQVAMRDKADLELPDDPEWFARDDLAAVVPNFAGSRWVSD